MKKIQFFSLSTLLIISLLASVSGVFNINVAKAMPQAPQYCGMYFNHIPDSVEFEGPIGGLIPGDTPFNHSSWWDITKLAFQRNDSNLTFGNDFFPIPNSLTGDPFHFTVHWRALLNVPADGSYAYTLESDDDSWLYIDGNLVEDLGGVHPPISRTSSVYLTQGQHVFNLYFAERHTVQSHMSFQWLTPSIGAVAECEPRCGDGSCNGNESCETCSQDCGECPEPICGDGDVNSPGEQCDGDDMGQADSPNYFCSVTCHLIPIYVGETECPRGTTPEKVGDTHTIGATDTDGIAIPLTIGKTYLFNAFGTFVPTSALGYFSDAGYTTKNNGADNWVTEFGIQGTDPDYAAHALLGDLGGGIGVIEWGTYNSGHSYDFVYTMSINDPEFVIGDRYADWFTTPYQNQSGMNDNSGELSLDIYECKEIPQEVVCPQGTEKTFLELVNVDSSNSSGANSSSTLNSGTQYLIEASGYWQNSLNLADTEYTSIDDWATYMDGYDIDPWFLGAGEFDVQIDGAFVNWGNYSPTHAYSYLYAGTGSPVNLLVFDGDSNTGIQNFGWYGDNSGSLTANIYECKAPECTVDADCGDQSVCTTDTCSAEGTCVHASVTCFDQDPCTDDSCNADTGCVFTPNDQCVCDPGVELITNGGFEEPIVTDGAGWDIFSGSPLNWFINWMAGVPLAWGGYDRPDASLELQRGVNGWGSANNSDQHAELDADWFGPGSSQTGEPASVKIYQDVQTIPGKNYDISFWFSPRPNTALENNALQFSWDNLIKDTITGAGDNTTTWVEHTYTFAATSNTTRIEFADVGLPQDSLGTLLDDVSVKCRPAVCGNQIMESGEQCDDGNTTNEDGCSSTCQLEQIIVGCDPGATQSCGTGLQGICSAGTQTCTEHAVWGECVQNTSAGEEICGNDIDENCDGSAPSCGGGPLSVINSSGGGGTPGPYEYPTGQVAGAFTEQPTGEVLGESTERLPETGKDVFPVIALALLMALGSAVSIKKLLAI